MATHSSILAWRVPWTEEPGSLQSMGLPRVRHDWATNTFLPCFFWHLALLYFAYTAFFTDWRFVAALSQASLLVPGMAACSLFPAESAHFSLLVTVQEFSLYLRVFLLIIFLETPVLWPPHAKSWLIGKDPDAGRDWGQEEKGTTEDEMVGWHHWLDGCESQWTLGVGDGQGGLACCDSWGHKESDTTERLIWSDLIWWWSLTSDL